jgi:membrane protein DedA with SNARE-associated domain
MPSLMQLIEQYGLLLVFTNVLVEQLGAPVPAVPTMVATGALAAYGAFPLALALAVTTSACVLADCVWYSIGRRSGRRALNSLCRLSPSPEDCPQRAEGRFMRRGPLAIVLAKFVPGFGILTTTLAGVLGTSLSYFLALDALGAMLWTGLNLFLGWWLHDSVAAVLEAIARSGRWGLAALAALLAVWVGSKLWRMRHVRRDLATTVAAAAP